MTRARSNISDRLTNTLFYGLIRFALRLPYRRRVPFMGWIMARVFAPLAGYPRRIRNHLALACPDLDPAEVRRLTRAVPNNMGRTIIEIYSGQEFVDRMARAKLNGPGFEALRAARDAGRPVIAVTGHFGNYDAPRSALIANGYHLEALYRPMNNRFFNAHYARAIHAIGPVHPRARRGFATLVKHLKSGGMIGIVVDQHMRQGEDVTFFGHTARTATSAADLALRYNAILVPMYGVRQPDGLSFDLVFEDPIPHGDAVSMTQAINDSLETITRKNMDQWMWSHRRWQAARD